MLQDRFSGPGQAFKYSIPSAIILSIVPGFMGASFAL